jgi:3-oxoacyl-[acyl-carrier protein] reductase
MLDTNLRGTLLVCRQACKPLLRSREGGSIVNVGSVIASLGNTGQAAYAASKAGMAGLTRSLARELGPRGIRVNCVEPGFIVGGMTQHLDEAKRAECVRDEVALRAPQKKMMLAACVLPALLMQLTKTTDK